MSDVSCTAFIGVGDEEISGCESEWAFEKSGSEGFDDPQPKSESDRLCCQLDVRSNPALGL